MKSQHYPDGERSSSPAFSNKDHGQSCLAGFSQEQERDDPFIKHEKCEHLITECNFSFICTCVSNAQLEESPQIEIMALKSAEISLCKLQSSTCDGPFLSAPVTITPPFLLQSGELSKSYYGWLPRIQRKDKSVQFSPWTINDSLDAFRVFLNNYRNHEKSLFHFFTRSPQNVEGFCLG